MRIHIPPIEMHPAQQIVEASPARFKVLANGRRWGKTLSSLEWLLFAEGGSAIDGWPVGFFAPTYQLMLEVWKDAERTLRPVTRKANKTENRIELVTGGVVDFWTLQDDGAGRGRKYKRVVVDEAAHARYLQDAWERAILPTLTDYAGEARIISTPAGRNYFWKLYQQGVGPAAKEGWESFTFPTTANPFIQPDEVERMRALLPERVFAQEYLAQFLEDGGGVFRGVSHMPACDWLDRGLPGAAYTIGADWGRHEDFTVFSVLDSALRLVHLDRFTGVGYELQTGRLKALWERFNRCPVLAEVNSMGGPLIERLQRERVSVRAFHTSNASKAGAIEALALDIENGRLALPLDARVAPLRDELLAFEQERLPSGLIRYAAPPGQHDDCVMSLAIAHHGASAPAINPGFKVELL